jgi:hypothetical protein
MRSTGGADVDYAIDAPPQDSTAVVQLRAKGAIVYAKANLDEYNGGAAIPVARRARPARLRRRRAQHVGRRGV